VQLAGQHGILQIHPTRRCNLSCLHCYSDSGPTQREELSPDLLGVVIDDAAELGYRTLSVSGGEPLMYRPLPEVLAHARGRGLRTLVTTNGTLSDRRRLGPLAAHIDLLAISLDGPPAEHDLMRAMPGAFASLLRRLEAVRATGMTFGFLFTLTQHNVHQLEWAVDFAIEQGAAMLQIHPLDATGRGASLASSMPDRYECAVAVLEVARLRQSAGDRLYIHLDLAIRPALAAHAKRFQDAACDGSASLAEVVTPLAGAGRTLCATRIRLSGAVCPRQRSDGPIARSCGRLAVNDIAILQPSMPDHARSPFQPGGTSGVELVSGSRGRGPSNGLTRRSASRFPPNVTEPPRFLAGGRPAGGSDDGRLRCLV